MAQIDNQAQGNLGDILRRLRALEFASNQNNMAVGRGGIRVHGGGGITIENGGLSVTGSATISGLLEASGTINMTGTFTATGDVNLNGPVDIAGNTTITGDVTSAGHFTQTGPTDLNGTTTVAGDTTVTGDFTVNGPMKTTGTLDVEGVTTLKNDLNVTIGKIVAGEVTIDPSYLDGSLRFSNGSYVAATPNGAQFKVAGSGAGFVTVGPSQADMGAGSYGFILNASTGFTMLGLPTTSNPANLYIDPSTSRIYRSTA